MDTTLTAQKHGLRGRPKSEPHKEAIRQAHLKRSRELAELRADLDATRARLIAAGRPGFEEDPTAYDRND